MAVTLIRGRVLDPRGDPVAGAAVYVVSAPVALPDIAMLTNEQGEFDLAFQAPGLYTIGARSDEWGAAQAGVEVVGEEAISLQMRLNKSEGA